MISKQDLIDTFLGFLVLVLFVGTLYLIAVLEALMPVRMVIGISVLTVAGTVATIALSYQLGTAIRSILYEYHEIAKAEKQKSQGAVCDWKPLPPEGD